MLMHDRAPIGDVRRLPDGRIAAVAKFARSGCYTYSGAEVGRPDLSQVTVYRADDEVFAADAMASFAHKAITIDHPSESVTASNWQRVSVGFTEGRVARDGGFLQIPLMLADSTAVQALDAGKKELSAGYNCELVWGDGVAPDGTPFQARQTNIRGDHIALVAAGRAGSDCRIGDSASSQGGAYLTDAEMTFRDSPQGREAIALAKASHFQSRDWTAADEQSAIRSALAANSCARRASADMEAQRSALQAAEHAAYIRSTQR